MTKSRSFCHFFRLYQKRNSSEREVLLERAEINTRQLNSQLRRQLELQGSSLVSEFELEQTEANRDLAVADAKLVKVRLRQEGSYVFRINEENKAERVSVDIGDSSGDLIGVTGLLAEGDRVAVRGAENLREGAEVKIIVSLSAAEVPLSEG